MSKMAVKYMNKILAQSIFPAPYRVNLFELVEKKYEMLVFFERTYDSNRNCKWFIQDSKIKSYVLDNKKSRNIYNKTLKKISNYNLVLMYEYSTIASIKLMIKCLYNKIPYIINCDGAFINKNIVKNAVKKFFIKRAAACLASGQYAKNYFLTFGAREERIYIHNFTTLFNTDISKSVVGEDEKKYIKYNLGLKNRKIVLAVGRFIKSKRFDVLIKSWKYINDMKYDYELIIIGGGDEKQDYISEIENFKISNITLIDYLEKEKLKQYYLASDLFVLPTASDTWGLVINEAMAFGLPIITTDKCIAGLELIENNINGYIVPVGDDAVLSSKIISILQNDKLRQKMSENNLNKIRNYTIENMAEQQLKVIKKVLGE